MPAAAETTAKPRISIKRPNTPLKIVKSVPAKEANATIRSNAISAAGGLTEGELNTDSCNVSGGIVASSPLASSSSPMKTQQKKVKKSPASTRVCGSKSQPTSPLASSATQQLKQQQPPQQQQQQQEQEEEGESPSKAKAARNEKKDADGKDTGAASIKGAKEPQRKSTDNEASTVNPQLQASATVTAEKAAAAAAPAVLAVAETRPSLPAEDANNASDDGLDVTSTSSVSGHSQAVANADGSMRRVPEQVTSLAGKRHTKTVVNPHSSSSNNNNNFFTSSGGGGGSGSAFGSLNPPLGGTGASSSRPVGASGRRSGLAGAMSGSGGGGHHHIDNTLRYRTDLDKQVIHFMFERYHQEQICPTASSAVVASSTAEAVEGGDRAAHHSSSNCGSRTSVLPLSHAPSAAASPLLTGAASSHARRIAVEEIYVPPNGEGDDKNIGLGDWHFFWMHVARVRHTICSSDFRWQDQQIINHFPDHAELTRKDLMYKNIKRYLRENQANNYARLTLHTATDWVAAAANAAPASATSGGAAASGEDYAGTAASPNTLLGGPSASGVSLSTKAFCFADSVPITYNIPNDMSMFKEECQRQRGTQWIVKPTSRSQGKGIFIIDDVRALQRWVKEKKDMENSTSFFATVPMNRASWAPLSAQQQQQQRAAQLGAGEATAANNSNSNGNDNGAVRAPGSPTSSTGLGVTTANNGGASNPAASLTAAAVPAAEREKITGGGGLGAYIVSRYISNPLLIGGKKFDLRLYVLVTSYKPLVAYLHEDGFARFCATRYNGRSLAQEDLGSHLTNVALQKGDEHYNTSHGGKWSFQNLFLYVQSRYGPYAAEGMMKNIQFLIYHSLKAVEPVMFNDKHSFELYGYDILIDDQINPHLIEVNASPSMSTTTVSDRLLKEQVLTDTMKILFPPGFPINNKAMTYWEYRQRTDLTTQQQTGFKLLQF